MKQDMDEAVQELALQPVLNILQFNDVDIALHQQTGHLLNHHLGKQSGYRGLV